MTFLVPNLEVVKAWLLSFGDSVEVLHLQELIGPLAEEATRLRAHYERCLSGNFLPDR